MPALETIELPAPSPAQASIIWLHGLGADGHDFVPVAQQLGLAHSRFIFPHAPERPVTLNNHMRMRAWYDIYGLDANAPEDRAGMQQSQRAIEALIDQEHSRGIPYANIILAGFSQGGAMALYTALHHKERLGGVIALSAYLPGAKDFINAPANPTNELAIFMAHGQEDPIVPIHLAEQSKAILVAQGHAVTWRCYPMAHEVNVDELAALNQWLGELVKQ
jgi:phospholipase/carboxylesterase